MDRCSNSGESTQTRERIRREAHEKVEKVAKHCVVPMSCGSGGSKVEK